MLTQARADHHSAFSQVVLMQNEVQLASDRLMMVEVVQLCSQLFVDHCQKSVWTRFDSSWMELLS